MGLFDKVKKAITGGNSAPSKKQEANAKAKSNQGKNRSGQGQRSQSQTQRTSSGSSNSRRRGSRGGRGRSGQGQGQGQQGTGQRQTQGGSRQSGNGRRDADGKTTGSSSGSNRRRRRGGSGRSNGSSAGTGASPRTVTRSNAAELKEQQAKSSSKKSSGSSRNANRNRSGGKNRNNSRRRERTRRGSASSGSYRRVLDANERPKDPVKKQILINAADPNEIRIAIREQQKVVEVYVERKGKRSLAGNIYKGRVQNVLRGMEAAFVDIGLDRNGFLYVDEITPAAADSDQIMTVSMVTDVDAGDKDSTTDSSSTLDSSETLDYDDAMEEEDREAEQSKQASESEAKGEADKAASGAKPGSGQARVQSKKKIQDLLKPGQEILCQVVKDPMGTKGSRLTTQYSLAGRYLVFVPDGDGLGVSRRLEDAERNRLRDIVKQFELPWGGGLIVRTAAEGALEEDIAKDLELLLRLHEQLMDKASQTHAPKLLYNEVDLSLRIIRDLMNEEVEEVLIDDARQFQRIMNYLKRTSPSLGERVRLHDGQRPLFESYGVDEAIRSTLSKRADLPSGGYLIIDKTEAFHVIDVNTGRNVGTASLEETITKTNMEAAEEVVRQLRLRDLGGIIVIDFIDMNLMKNRDAVLEHFRKELSKDRTKTYLVEISPLGLVEMTRQNVSEGVREILTSTCRACEGRGVTISAETHAIDVERAVVELAGGVGDDSAAIAIEAQSDVAKALAGNEGKQKELNKRVGKLVRVFPDPDLSPNAFALRAKGTIEDIDSLPEPLLRGAKHKVRIERVDPACADDALTVVDGVLVTVVGAGSLIDEERTILISASTGGRAFATVVKPARRRRRRGGRNRRKAGEDTVTVETLDDDESTEFSDEMTFIEDLHDSDDLEGNESEDSEDDEASEIPQRLVLIEASDEDAEDDDEEDDEDEDVENMLGNDHEDALDESESSSDEIDDAAIGMALLAAESYDDGRVLARRTSNDDRDEPSIDVDGDAPLLRARGVELTSIDKREGPGESSKSHQGSEGSSSTTSGQRRRRRGSRGGRNRNRNRPRPAETSSDSPDRVGEGQSKQTDTGSKESAERSDD